MQALLITFGVFALILVLSRLRVPLSIAILSGSVVLGVLFGEGPVELMTGVVRGAVQPHAVALMVVTILLLGLSGLMQAGGQLEEIVDSAKAIFRRPAVTMAALPALIGLLPMPGGALFSAPMVASAAEKNKADAAMLSAVNYWYRHIWEHWWPMYPGVMLAMTLTGRPFVHFAMYQVPLGIGMAAAGLLLFRGTHPDLHTRTARAQAAAKRKLFWNTSSIWVILVVWVASRVVIVRWVTPGVGDQWRPVLEKFAPLGVGLLVSIVWTWRLKRLKAAILKKVFGQKSLYTMTALVLSVMVFQYILESVGAAHRIAEELVALHVPVVLVVGVLPFIAGMVTGIAIAFVGTSFPIVLALVNSLPEAGPVYAYVALAYGLGHLGQMMSPLHLCYIMSNEYFKTGYGPVYRRMVPTAAVTGLWTVGYYLLLRVMSG